jgi:UDP-N-acetylglucosamine/UDP-N-acetylgalactosamine diphosphorylase
MPAMDLETGRLILEERGKLFLSPDGHGGMLYALAGSGLLDRLRQRGFEHVFYFQVDNPLIKVLDPVFLGRHVMHRSDASSKTVAKLGPDEAAGVFARVEGACRILEYSELNDELRQRRDPSGRLALWAASPAIHIFDLAFLARIAEHPEPLPFHAARKKTPYLNEEGKLVEPTAANALKLERFIFDTLPRAERWLILETPRAEEFAPVKNKKGADTPEIAKAMITRQTAAWLEAAGVSVPRDASGEPAHPLEVSPLYALDAEELVRRVDASTRIDGPWYGG